MDNEYSTLIDRTVEYLRKFGKLAVEFSGGTDSVLLAKLAVMALNDNTLAVIGVSPSLPQAELEDAKRIANEIGIRFIIVDTQELDQSGIRDNGPDRCYYCRKNRANRIGKAVARLGTYRIADGVNASDMNEYRPGVAASDEAGYLHPFLDLGITKDDIRGMSRVLGLPTWNKPASACLSSRIEHGTRITADRLHMVEEGEKYILAMGFRKVRVRYHQAYSGPLARIELGSNDIQRFLELPEEARSEISDKLSELGFLYITLDLNGYRPGG